MNRAVAGPHAPGFHLRFPPSGSPFFHPASAERQICSRGWVSLECVCPREGVHPGASERERVSIQVPLSLDQCE